MRKIILSLITFIFICTCLPVKAQEVSLNGEEAILMDLETGYILYEKDMNKKMYPASMTKVLTVITALEEIKDVNKLITIQKRDLDTVWETGASSANFVEGETVTYRDLILGALIPSGADACRALGFNIAGSQEKFISKMNKLAKKIGAKDSNFENTTGIHADNHYTTVYDMALIMQYAMGNPIFADLIQSNTATSSNGQHTWGKKVIRHAWGHGLKTGPIYGCKSGYTKEAMSTLVSVVKANNRKYVTVIGKTDNGKIPSGTVADTLALANFASTNFSEQLLFKKDDKLGQISIKEGAKNQIIIKAQEDITFNLPNNYQKDELKVKLKPLVEKAPIEIGDKLVEVKIEYQGKMIFKNTYTSQEAIAQDTLRFILTKAKKLFFPYGIAIIFSLIFLLVLKTKPRKYRR